MDHQTRLKYNQSIMMTLQGMYRDAEYVAALSNSAPLNSDHRIMLNSILSTLNISVKKGEQSTLMEAAE